MALTRRQMLWALPATTGLVAACSSQARKGDVPMGPLELFRQAPAGTAKGTILVAMPETKQTAEVWAGLVDELGGQYRLVAVRAEGDSAANAIAEGLRQHRPAGVVLMNNPTVAAYGAAQERHAVGAFPPAVIVMTSFLDRHPAQIAGATGISYEVPLITVVTNLRKLLAGPLERVGVVVRPPQRGFVARQAELARREEITVVECEVSAKPNSSEIKWALRKLRREIDALWILNDDRLLSPRLIAEGWLPALDERPYHPTIVGAASLVSPARSFGTFAVLPDHTALGVQTANMLFSLADSHWTLPPGAEVELPLSTTTTVDLAQVHERFTLRDNALQQVDHILE